ncbi:universal stress protein [Scytonema sp. NUACC26]|uniref:universal stress protein n=1 Tax=Scytonema sp. NUACC26 TaxID=3140176 RepID=UPI0034DCC059
MFKKILVALDRSESHKQIFERGLTLAQLTGASLMLLHVLSAEEKDSPELPMFSTFDYSSGVSVRALEFYQQQWNEFEQDSIKMLRSLCAQANTVSINTEFTQNFGSPGRVICNLARNWNADLIVLGRRGRSGLTEFFLGSVSNYVLHHAPCSVHVVHLPLNIQATEVVQETNSVSSAS